MARRKQSLKHKAHRRRRLPLHLEQLEQRLLMDGDNNLAPLAGRLSLDTSSANVISPSIESTVTPATIGQFVIADLDIAYYEPPTPFPVPAEGFESVEELRDWVVDAIDAQYGHLFGTSYARNYWPWLLCGDVNLDLAVPVAFSSVTSGSVAASSSSTTSSETNVQVEGVDEADLLETDGEFIYLVTGNELIIVDARDGENLTILSRVELGDQPTGIYLSGDRLTLISSQGSMAEYNDDLRLVSWGGVARLDSTLGAAETSATTTVTVLDLSDRAAPSLVQKTELRGSLVSSRMVDGQLRLVLSHRMFHLPGPRTDFTHRDESGQETYTYETRDEYLDRVLEDRVDSLLSTYRTFSVDGEVIDVERLMQPEDLSLPDFLGGSTRTTIATFDVLGNDVGPAATKTLVTGGATEVYSTRESLYVFGMSNDYYSAETTIQKFDFDAEDHSIRLAAKGRVDGTLLNQFAVDEHDGYLRVVTTGSSWRSGQLLLVLEQVGRQLKVVGSVENIAPGENLHSVRFMGDRAFVVTFEKVDPLFAIDLTDPENPTIAGELKIPGYSDYLQPIDENHLLGIGRDADITGGLFRELQISIFDVSDLDDPQLAHRYSFDGGRSTASITTGGRWSRGDGDHHAVGYFPSAEILAIPIFSADQGGGFTGGVDNAPIFGNQEGGLQVFSVNVADGFEPLTLIEHDSPILRSLRIGDSLLAFSAGEISSHDITDPTTQLDSLQLLVGSEVGLVELQAFYTGPAVADLFAVASRLSTSFQETSGGFSEGVEVLDETRSAEAELSLMRSSTNQDELAVRGIDATDLAITQVIASEEISELVAVGQENFEQSVDTVFDIALL